MKAEYDLAIIGGGPAGLSAAINGASELPRVILFDSGKKDMYGTYQPNLGGQALGSTSIENYAGFPGGISGEKLMRLFVEQSQLLGSEIACPQHVATIQLETNGRKHIVTREGMEVSARAVILAPGLSYRKLEAVGVKELIGKGVLYGAPTSSPSVLGKCTVFIVGGANSVGQAVMHLSQNLDISIKILVRGQKGIEEQMSKYLVDRIRACPRVEVITDVQVSKVVGTERLTDVELMFGNGEKSCMKADHLFVFIGAMPKTEWLSDAVKMDSKKFIATGAELGTVDGRMRPFETSMAGVFAAGDIRLGSVKRVASAVGEGAQAVSWVHNYLSGSAF